jgi:hypothetical protein
MNATAARIFLSVMICLAMAVTACSAVRPVAGRGIDPQIQTSDVERFYAVYGAAGAHPTAEQLQRDYIDPGSDGLQRFFKLRNTTAARLADAIDKHPDVYADAKRCLAVLPQVRPRLKAALRKLARLYPQAAFPPVTIVVGRTKPTGVTDAAGVMIGLESLCAVSWMNPNLEDRFVYVSAHEYAHVQQARNAPALYDAEHPTVLEVSIVEGAAEFTGELISGGATYSFLRDRNKGREKEIETAFVRDEDKTDLSDWLYNGTLEKAGDLGYWVGYRISKAYYEHAPDKRRALAEILGMTDAHAFLARSGWYPGIQLN